nr:hypothetical protein [Tanacetum cinerariifolium]
MTAHKKYLLYSYPNLVSTHPMVTSFRVGTNRPTQRLTLHVLFISLLHKSYVYVFNDPTWKNTMTDKYGTLSRYKPRLVANGYTQLFGVDVDETFSPVVKQGTTRIVLGLDIS